MIIILDTNIWLRYITEDPKIEKSGFEPYIKYAKKDRKARVPAICTWEIAMLVSKNRITLSEKNPLLWIQDSLFPAGLIPEPLTPEIAVESATLPGDFHKDPADQMVVATARILNATLLTFDRKILEYAKKGHVKVIPPL